jgi:hypothetical protein
MPISGNPNEEALLGELVKVIDEEVKSAVKGIAHKHTQLALDEMNKEVAAIIKSVSTEIDRPSFVSFYRHIRIIIDRPEEKK